MNGSMIEGKKADIFIFKIFPIIRLCGCLIDLQDNLIDSFASLLFVVIAFEC
jgi:hypothetical protein